MADSIERDLSRRERQIMDLLHARGEASAVEIAGALPDPPTSTAVRTMLRILESKGQVTRRKEGRRHLYRPAASRARAARQAMRRVLRIFFGGSLGEAVAAHLSDPSVNLEPEELERLARAVRRARKGK